MVPRQRKTYSQAYEFSVSGGHCRPPFTVVEVADQGVKDGRFQRFAECFQEFAGVIRTEVSRNHGLHKGFQFRTNDGNLDIRYMLCQHPPREMDDANVVTALHLPVSCLSATRNP